MVHTDSIPSKALVSIADQIGRRLPSILDAETLTGVEIELAETFQLWVVGAESVTRTNKYAPDLNGLAHQTNRWHHQITFNGEAKAIARSYCDEGLEDCRLSELFMSPLAAKIQKAASWIDHGETPWRDCLVRLLVAPAYRMHALWLYDELKRASQILVIDYPEEFRTLRFEKPVNAGEFLTALSHAPHIIGYTHNTY